MGIKIPICKNIKHINIHTTKKATHINKPSISHDNPVV